MLDSPYVRRVAVSMQLLGLQFEHRPISVFGAFAQFQGINPIVKAPTLVCDDGKVLMDSTLILQYVEAISSSRKSLFPTDIADLRSTLRTIGLALAACEKSFQVIYEQDLSPAAKRNEPWLNRITGQLLAAYAELEDDLTRRPLVATSSSINQAGVSVAVAWRFTQSMLPGIIDSGDYPTLQKFSAKAETLPEFVAAPHGLGTYHQGRQ